MAEQPERRTATEARAGTPRHIVRYVLGISLTLAVIAMIIVMVVAR